MNQAALVGIQGPADGRATLTVATRLWFLVMLIGQWAFFYYLAGFYVRSIVTGHPEEWNLNHMLPRGYVAGDPHWDLYLGAHVMLAAVIAFGGTLQMIPWIRAHAPGFHRWNGRVFMLTALGGGLTGLWMVWMRGADLGGGAVGNISLTLDALLIVIFGAIAWALVRKGRIEAHRRWALRLFMVANGVWFLRVGVFGWYLLTGGIGLGENLTGPAGLCFDFASYLLPLAVLQLYLRARDGDSYGARITAAAFVSLSTAYICVGTFGLTMAQLPLLPRL